MSEYNYKSQFGQDKWLIENVFRYKKNGYFIDCGAGHCTNGSNTYVLEKDFNWTGVAIDINLDGGWGIQRSCSGIRALLSDKPNKFEKIVPGGGTTGILDDSSNNYIQNNVKENGYYWMPTVTLTQVLDAVKAPAIIDFFSLDVEGHELSVLKGLDVTKYTIETLCIEYNLRQPEGPNYILEDFLESEGYVNTKAKISRDTIWQKNHNNILDNE